ncbi:MmgE/PrpD family protein [Rhodobacteraceae bacterium NNCM2]|nr:MmgE/PrpD family protein [Coraliihabitans acroporae]
MLRTGPVDFIHQMQWADLTPKAQEMTRLLVLDLLGVAASARVTPCSQIICNHAARQFGPGGAPATILFDGRKASPVGAALAGGMTIDAVDGHDGWRPSKGHAGCHVLPAALAFAEAEGQMDGAAFLCAVALGYEFGLRVAVAQHATVPDYHTSGSWGAVGVAAVGARMLGLDRDRTREAIGIAEYHGPRSQMMRGVEFPTMVKDGSGWGAMAGVSAAYLAADGFTGAPAVTVEAEEAASFWQDLGNHWLMEEQYIKPYPICRWTHGPLACTRHLIETHGVTHDQIDRVEVTSFANMLALATWKPENTEQAQYSVPFPVATMIVKGAVGPGDVMGDALSDPDVLWLAERVMLIEDPALTAEFPARRKARVAFVMKDGRRLESGIMEPLGDPERPLSEAEIRAKFHAWATPVLGAERALRLEAAVDGVEAGGLGPLLAELGAV